jgi:hypothetical protein
VAKDARSLFFTIEMKYRRTLRRHLRLPGRSIAKKPTETGGVMAEETAEEKLARLEAENRALKDQINLRKPGELRLKISEKGGLSVYGLGRFPVTLYKEQWTKLLNHSDDIKRFLQDHDQELKAKQ